MSAPHDPWKDILAGWCGKPWEPTRFGVVGSYGWCAHCGASQQVHDIGTARAADAARHQQEIAAKDAELDKLRVFLGDASPKSDALRRQFDAEIATLRATVDQQAETIHQLQATLPELHDAIERQSAQIAALTQERDAAIAENIRLTNAEIEALSARCATLTAALEWFRRHDNTAVPYQINCERCERITVRVDGDSMPYLCHRCVVNAALAAAPQGDKA